METVWKLKKTPINDAQELAEQLVIPVPVANVMIQRGIDTPELAREFFDLSPEKLHDPWLLPDIHKVIDRLEKAINEKEYIYIQKNNVELIIKFIIKNKLKLKKWRNQVEIKDRQKVE